MKILQIQAAKLRNSYNYINFKVKKKKRIAFNKSLVKIDSIEKFAKIYIYVFTVGLIRPSPLLWRYCFAEKTKSHSYLEIRPWETSLICWTHLLWFFTFKFSWNILCQKRRIKVCTFSNGLNLLSWNGFQYLIQN